MPEPQITAQAASEHEQEIHALFRNWVLACLGKKNFSEISDPIPDWMDGLTYEIIHKCIRETARMYREGIFDDHPDSKSTENQT